MFRRHLFLDWGVDWKQLLKAPLDDIELPELTYHLKNELGIPTLPSRKRGKPSLSKLAQTFHMDIFGTKNKDEFEDDRYYSPPDVESDCSGIV